MKELGQKKYIYIHLHLITILFVDRAKKRILTHEEIPYGIVGSIMTSLAGLMRPLRKRMSDVMALERVNSIDTLTWLDTPGNILVRVLPRPSMTFKRVGR